MTPSNRFALRMAALAACVVALAACTEHVHHHHVDDAHVHDHEGGHVGFDAATLDATLDAGGDMAVGPDSADTVDAALEDAGIDVVDPLDGAADVTADVAGDAEVDDAEDAGTADAEDTVADADDADAAADAEAAADTDDADAAPDVTPPPPPPVTLALEASPAFAPAFAPEITDYVVPCAGAGEVTLTYAAELGATVSVQAQGQGAVAQPGPSGTVSLPWAVGRRVTITASAPDRSPVVAHIRCLPADFPAFQAQSDGAATADFYLAVGLSPIDPKDGAWKPYPVVWDRFGVPIWWGKSGDAVYFTLLSDGKPAWTQMGLVPGGPSQGAVKVDWDGNVLATYKAVGGDFDIHDLIRLPDGTILIAAWTEVKDVDLSAIGGPSKTSIFDQVMQELGADGSVVWSWSSAAHIPVSEMSPTWRPQFIDKGKPPYDVHHWNSIEPIPGGYLLSFRHLDAVYAIDRATGKVRWKLGGTPTAESLTIVGDPVFPWGSFGGQHDARLLPDGSITLHDNGSGLGRPPRMLRYHIAPPPIGVATLLESYSDATIAQSICCGSVRKLASGSWVIGWGGRETISEVSPAGKQHYRLTLQKGALLYRAEPVASGVLDRATLRAGMDAQYP